MARDGSGIGGRLFAAGARLVTGAARTVLSDPRGQDAVARAVGLAQRGRRRMEEVQERFMDAAGIPGKQDYQDLAKQLARLKRKARELAERLEPEGEGAEGDAGGDPGERGESAAPPSSSGGTGSSSAGGAGATAGDGERTPGEASEAPGETSRRRSRRR